MTGSPRKVVPGEFTPGVRSGDAALEVVAR
jgi:hypothetical protein